MKNKISVLSWAFARMAVLTSAVVLVACGGTPADENAGYMTTPTVDYVEQLDVYSAPHQDSFLNQLAMNYRSYAIYNARTSGYPDMGELFAQKAVAAFSGELPFPETLDNWPIENEQESFELYTAYNELLDQLKNDASDANPQLAAEAQAKFDCWLSAAASGQTATAAQCRERFQKTMIALRDCSSGKIVSTEQATKTVKTQVNASNRAVDYYPDTRTMTSMKRSTSAREGVIVVNNVNVPEHLINPVPVQQAQPQQLVFNQNIYGGDKTISKNNNNSIAHEECEQKNASGECEDRLVIIEKQAEVPEPEIPMIGDELVTRDEFINMMMAMRAELAAINARLDDIQAAAGEKTMIKVQQIPLEPKQHVMEEILEVRFDFDKAVIKPEYRDLIEKLANAAQNNRNIKVSVVGHTDTMGSRSYNYALGGRRAEAVQKMLIQYGVPASQIVAVSAGEEDLAVQTPDNTPNAANRRVRVVKETHYEEPGGVVPISVEVQEVVNGVPCDEYGCWE